MCASFDLTNISPAQDYLSNPRGLLLYGPKSSGKSELLQALFKESDVAFTWIDSDQCVTTRVLLQRAYKEIIQANHDEKNKSLSIDSQIENIGILFSELHSYQVRHNLDKTPRFLVFDNFEGFERLSGDMDQLFYSFVRMGESNLIQNICPIFITERPLNGLSTTHVPFVRFPMYTQQEAIDILTLKKDLCRLPDSCLDQSSSMAEIQRIKFWGQFSNVLVGSVFSFTGGDIELIKTAAKRIWSSFIKPLIKGAYEVDDFLSLYRDQQDLFKSDKSVSYRLISKSSNRHTKSGGADGNELPLQSKLIICAAYLASYNPPRYDIRFFSKSKEARAKRRDTGRRKPVKINPRMLAAPPFELERMLAILHAIAPASYQLISNVDIGAQVATLRTLNMITKQGDTLDSRTKWKVNVSYRFVERVADQVGVDIQNYLFE